MAKKSSRQRRGHHGGGGEAFPWRNFLQAAMLLLAGLWIYAPALHGDWLWDDDIYITNSTVKHDPWGLLAIWFEPNRFIEFYPIEASVQWLQCQLFGDDTFGYHLTNVLLHVLSALLVWKLLAKFNLRLAWWGALLFVVHPAMVESVAWISELKNALSLPPFLLALCAWIDFQEGGRKKDYARALLWFLTAMLCKISMAMFPLVIFLYAWWKRGRIGWSDAKESAPFFAVSLILGMATALLGRQYDLTNSSEALNIPAHGVPARVALGGLSLGFYFLKSVLPIGLVPMYPQWTVSPPSFWQFLPWVVLAWAAGWFWLRRGTWGRHALLGCGFFVILLLPFIGFKDISYMRFTWVMDHFLYIPIIGLIGLAVAGAERLWPGLPPATRPGCFVGAVLIAAVLAVGSHRYAKIFAGPVPLWTYTLKHNPNSVGAHDNLGVYYSDGGNYAEGISQFEDALQIDPDDVKVLDNLGVAWVRSQNPAEATAEFRAALRLNPGDAKAHNDLGNLLAQTGHSQEGLAEFREAVRLNPEYVDALIGLGGALMQSGDAAGAVPEFEAASRLDEANVTARVDFALTLVQCARAPEALDEIERAAALDPNNPSVHDAYGYILSQLGREQEAIEQYQSALTLNPEDGQAHYRLGELLLKSGWPAEAAEQFRAALQIMPGNADIENDLNGAEAQLGAQK
jgi:tetratricopeptide (TPR) repeat protein